MTNIDVIQAAKNVFFIESNAVARISERLDSSFVDAIDEILASKGRVIICGMGKSGIIGKKIAATMASTGTPSFFMHPGEAYHGDLGMVTADDIFIAISNSGETDEVIKLIPFLKSNGNYLIALTGNPRSSLAKAASSHLDISVSEEACPLQLAPTSSTTATLAMGDALAVTLMQARDFRPENFARFHPGGSLGRRLLRKVDDEMIITDLPFIDETAELLDVIQAMTLGSLGLAIVRHSDGWGIITDGDIRRAIEKNGTRIFTSCATDIMNPNPATICAGTRMEDALILMESRRITSLLVVENNNIIGVINK